MSEPVRILIVEDALSDFDLAQREIRRVVHECVFQQAQTRDDFLRALETFQPDLILSDYHMPTFDGMTALQLAQEHAKLTPFIIWTGTMSEDIAVEFMRAGAVNYILKDNIKRLGIAVAHALEEGRLLLEHKQAEETIHNNEKRFRTLIENSRDNISLLAADGTLLWESPATIRSLGYAQDEFLGHNIFELMHPDDLQWTSELYTKLIHEPGSRHDGIFRLRHNDGSWRWNEATVTNLLNEPGVNAIVVNYRDITERKQAEEMLEKERNLLRTLIDNLPDRIFAMDTQGRKTLSNTADWRASGGETMEDVLGKTDFDTYPPELAQEFWALDKAVLDSGEPVINYEEPGLDSEGKPVWVLSTKVPLRDNEGKVAGLVGIGRDITDLKRAEMERRALLEIMQGLANTDDLQEFLKLIHHSIASVIYAENFFVVFYNKDSGLFEEAYSVDQYDQPSPPSALEKSITSYVFRSGEPLLLTQALFDKLVAQGEVELVGTNSESWMGAPLKTQNGTIGVIAVQHYEDPNRYTERDRDFLALIGSQVALAIERKRAEDRLRLSDQILQRVNAVVLVADSQGSIVYVSPAARTILGYEPDELLGDNWWKVSRPEPAAAEREKEVVGRVARGEKPVFAEAYERAIQDRSGNTRWISWVDAPGLGNTLIGVGHDITERKQAEKALRQSENRYSLASKATNDVIREWDQETNQLFWNENAQSVFGYPAEEIGRDETWWEDHIHADERERVLSKLSALIAGDESIWKDEYRFLRGDGSYAFIIDRAYVERDAGGKPSRMIGAMSDITTRKEVEDALRDREQRLNAIIENEPECIKILASDGLVLQMNPAGLAMFEADNIQAVLGKSVYPIVTAEYRQAFQDLTERVFMGESGKLEFEIVGLKGTHRWLDTHAVPMRNEQGDVMGLLGITRDITDRKGSEDQLKYHARLLRHINDAVIATDDQLRITAWNRAAEKMYGWPSEEVMGHNVSEILNFELGDEQRAEARELLKESITSRSETVHQHRDGRTLYVESNTIALLNEHGRMTGYVSVNRDITERKRAEKALHQSEEQYRDLFEDSPISLWVEDFSGVKQRLDELMGKGIVNIPAYFREHPHFVTELARHVRILDVNNAAMKLYHARQKSELLGTLADVFHILVPEQFETELIQIANGRLNFEREQVDQTLTGEKIHVNVRWSVAPGYEDSLAQVIVSTLDITERKRAEEQTQLQLQRVRALHAIDIAISSSFDLSLTLNLLIDQVIAQLRTDAAVILLFHPSTRTLEHAASRGFRSPAIREARLRLGEGYAGKAILERRMIHISNLVETDRELAYALSLKTENFIEYYGVPLIVKGEVKGVLEIFHRSALADDPEWVDFLETLAGQAAIAIDNATLFEDVQHSNRELFQAYDATIEGWSHALDLRDKETEGHTLRVTETTLELARKFGFTDEQLRHIRWGALLHDIGKMGVPDSILLKPDKLTDEEWTSMKQHPVFALEMLSPIAYLKSSLDIPYCHHEKWDGTGYPRGLKREVIPLAARLFAVVDVWDALRSDRPYRKAWAIEKTLEHIKSLSGTHFDPKVVEYFMDFIEQPNR